MSSDVFHYSCTFYTKHTIGHMSRTTGGMINFFNYIIMLTVPPKMAATLAMAVNIEKVGNSIPLIFH
jgi:hypothetical protein